MFSETSSEGLGVGFRLKTFFNHHIRGSSGHMAKVRTLVDMFREYYINIVQAEIDAKKTDKGKQKYKDILKTNLKFIDRNRSALVMAVASHVTLQSAKDFLINKMSEIQSIGHFLKTSTGYKVTSPEGYVAVDKVAGAVKLVDRMEFSRANFTMPKGWSN
jgi:phenylalanine-4-hydroxylase